MHWIFVHWFCILQPCCIYFLFLIISAGVFRIFYIKNHVICKLWRFYFFILNLDAFYFFSCLIALARSSSTVLSKSAESEHPCLVSSLKGKVFSFSPVYMSLAEGLSYMSFIMLRYFLSIPILLCSFLNHKSMLDLLNAFSASLIWSYNFFLSFINVVYYIDWFAYVDPS